MNFKILLLITSFVFISGCKSLTSTSKDSTSLVQTTPTPKINENQNLILLSSISNKMIGTLTSNDNWETATFIDLNKKTYDLTRAISADGIKLNNGSIVIHFKGNEGILEKNSIITYFLIK